MYIDGESGFPRLTPWEQLFSQRFIEYRDEEDDLRIFTAVSEQSDSPDDGVARRQVLELLEKAITDRLGDLVFFGPGGHEGLAVPEQVAYLWSDANAAEWDEARGFTGHAGLALTAAGEALGDQIDGALEAALAELSREQLWQAFQLIPTDQTLGWSPRVLIAETLCADDAECALELVRTGPSEAVYGLTHWIGTDRISALDATRQTAARFDSEFAVIIESAADDRRLAAALGHCRNASDHSAELWVALIRATEAGAFKDEPPSHMMRTELLQALSRLAQSPDELEGCTPADLDRLYLGWLAQQPEINRKLPWHVKVRSKVDRATGGWRQPVPSDVQTRRSQIYRPPGF
jgi:hypothetical protein